MYIIGVKVYDRAIKTVRVETSNYMRSQAEAIARSTLEKRFTASVPIDGLENML